MKKKYYLLLVAIFFGLLFIIFKRTIQLKYVLLGIAFLSGGIYFKMDDIDHPSTPHEKQVFAKGTIAWIVWVIMGLYLIFYYPWFFVKTGT